MKITDADMADAVPVQDATVTDADMTDAVDLSAPPPVADPFPGLNPLGRMALANSPVRFLLQPPSAPTQTPEAPAPVDPGLPVAGNTASPGTRRRALYNPGITISGAYDPYLAPLGIKTQSSEPDPGLPIPGAEAPVGSRIAPAVYDPGVSPGAVQQAGNAMSRGFLKGTGSLVGVVDPRGMTAANQTLEQTFPADPTLLNRTLESGGAMALPLAASAASGGTLMAPVMGAQGIGQGRMQAQELRNQGIEVSPLTEAGLAAAHGGMNYAGARLSLGGAQKVAQSMAARGAGTLAATAGGIAAGTAENAAINAVQGVATNALARSAGANVPLMQGVGEQVPVDLIIGSLMTGAHAYGGARRGKYIDLKVQRNGGQVASRPAGEEAVAAEKAIARTGSRVVWSRGIDSDGFVTPNGIVVLNADNPAGSLRRAGLHEMSHRLQVDSAYLTEMNRLLQNDPQLQEAAMREFAGTQEEQSVQSAIRNGTVTREMQAMIFEQAGENPDFLRLLMGKSPTVAGRIADAGAQVLDWIGLDSPMQGRNQSRIRSAMEWLAGNAGKVRGQLQENERLRARSQESAPEPQPTPPAEEPSPVTVSPDAIRQAHMDLVEGGKKHWPLNLESNQLLQVAQAWDVPVTTRRETSKAILDKVNEQIQQRQAEREADRQAEEDTARTAAEPYIERMIDSQLRQNAPEPEPDKSVAAVEAADAEALSLMREEADAEKMAEARQMTDAKVEPEQPTTRKEVPNGQEERQAQVLNTAPAEGAETPPVQPENPRIQDTTIEDDIKIRDGIIANFKEKGAAAYLAKKLFRNYANFGDATDNQDIYNHYLWKNLETRKQVTGYLRKLFAEYGNAVRSSQTQQVQPPAPVSQAQRLSLHNDKRARWEQARRDLQQKLSEGKRVRRADLEPFKGEQWADDALNAMSPARKAPADNAMSSRRAELEMQLRDAVANDLGRAAMEGMPMPLQMQVERGEKSPGSLVNIDKAMAHAESLPDNHPARMILHNLRELEKNPRGTKVEKIDTNAVEDGTRIVVNDNETLTVDLENQQVKDGIKSDIPEGGMTLYGKKVLPPAEVVETGEQIGASETTHSVSFEDLMNAPSPSKIQLMLQNTSDENLAELNKSRQVQREGILASYVDGEIRRRNTESIASAAHAKQTGIFGQNVTLADTGKQQKLFGESPKPTPDEDSRIIAKFGGEGTPTMFSRRIDTAKFRNRDVARIMDDIQSQVPVKPAPSIDLTQETTWRYLRRKFQDEFHPVTRAMQDIDRQTGRTYELENLIRRSTGVSQESIRQMYEDHVQPIIKNLRDNRIVMDEADTFLAALHAQERNREIARKNPLFTEGSGYSDQRAADILNAFRADKRWPAFENLANQMKQLRFKTLDDQVKSGLLSDQSRKQLIQTYQWYVPLRDETEPVPQSKLEQWIEGMAGNTTQRLGKGYSVGGPEMREARGRRSISDSPILFMTFQAEEAITRGQKNRVTNELLRLVTENPEPQLWKVHAPKQGAKQDDPYVAALQKSKNRDLPFVSTKVDGVEHVMEFRGNAVPLARAMKRMGINDASVVVKALEKPMRVYRSLQTSYSLDFILGNAVRDYLEANANMGAEQGKKFVKGMNAHLPRSYKAVWDIMGDPNARPGSEMHDYMREYRQHGGTVATFANSDFAGIKGNIERELDPKTGMLAGGAKAAGHVLEAVERINGAIENGTRLAAYVQARKSGMPAEKAAMLAKELTINFETKGEWGRGLNTLYAFSNPSIQGTFRAIRAIYRSPHGRKIAAGIMGLGLLDGLVIPSLMGEDENGRNRYDALPDYQKDGNLIIPLGGDRFVPIPLPYGLRLLYNAGRYAGHVSSGHKTPGDAAASLAMEVARTFNPLGTQATKLQTISPTLLQPVVQQEQNVNWMGRPIYPETYGDESKPDSQRKFRSASNAAVAMAEWMNELSGGDSVKPGKVDVSPNVLDHWMAFLTGGPGRTIGRVSDVVSRLEQGDKVPGYKIPVVGRFMGESDTTYDMQTRFKDSLRKADATYSQIRAYGKRGDSEGAKNLFTSERTLMENRSMLKSTAEKLDVIQEMEDSAQKAHDRNKLERIQRMKKKILADALKAIGQ